MPLLQTRLLSRILLALTSVVASTTFAAEIKETTGDRVRERILRMTEFFDTMLPGVLEKNNITLHINPKFADLRDQEYFRFPVELRYGLTDKLELQGGLVPFVPNPINSGVEHRWGPGEAKFGARYDLGRTFGFFDDTTLGLETRFPLGRPPIELNDHYTHLKPSIAAARRLLIWPATTFYANLSYDRSVDVTHRAAPPAGVERRNIVEFGPGLLYKPSEFGYFAGYRIRHIRNDFGWYLGHEVQFGTIWDIPLARTESWRLPGKWQVELAYKVDHEEGRGTGQGISARVNWRTTLREVLEHTKSVKLW